MRHARLYTVQDVMEMWRLAWSARVVIGITLVKENVDWDANTNQMVPLLVHVICRLQSVSAGIDGEVKNVMKNARLKTVLNVMRV